MDIEEYVFEEVVVKESSSPVFTLNGEEIDFWKRHSVYVNLSSLEQILQAIKEEASEHG